MLKTYGVIGASALLNLLKTALQRCYKTTSIVIKRRNNIKLHENIKYTLNILNFYSKCVKIKMLHNRIKNAREGNALPKGVSLSFLIPCGRDCVATRRENAGEGKHFSCAPSGAQFCFLALLSSWAR
jgi:hypothetical protein